MRDAYDTYLYKFKYRYIGRHMAVTPFKFPVLFRKPKKCRNSQEIRGQGSGKQFSPDTAGYSKSRFELNVRKNASNKIIFQIFAFLILAAGL